MDYQKIIYLLDNTPNQPNKFRTKNRVEINDDAHITYNTNSQIKFKTPMLKSILCNYCIYTCKCKYNSQTTANSSNWKNIIIKNCAPFTDWIA